MSDFSICPMCANHSDCTSKYKGSVRLSGYCENYMKGEKMHTNYDRIRAMSVEEIARFISERADGCEQATECQQHCYGCDMLWCEYESCLKWLNSEAEED